MSEEEYLGFILEELKKRISRTGEDEGGEERHSEELKRYEKMLHSPYFGKVRFIREGVQEPENIYIGVRGLKKEDKTPLIIDWRAPAAELYYDFGRGSACYRARSGIISGELIQKMQFKIEDSRMVYASECDMALADDLLRWILEEDAETRLKGIVTSIQSEQDIIIRSKRTRILVIQGCAGSGKTSVAMHRIAYLLYHRRRTLKSCNVLILSPNRIFSDYISYILPELGEENIMEMSFDDFACRELKAIGIEETQDIYDYLESIIYLTGMDAELARQYTQRVREKQSQSFLMNMNEFMQKLEEEQDSQKPELDTICSADKLKSLYRRFLAEYGYFPENGKDDRIFYEDVYPLLYLKYSLWGIKALPQVRHLVIDEMQDYSYLQYTILAKLFQCSMTILGDKCQCFGSVARDVRDFLPGILGRKIRFMELHRNYRSTWEITKFAKQFAKDDDAVPFTRFGRMPKIIHFINEEDKYRRLAQDLKKNQDARIIAVLTLNQETADQTAEKLKALLGEDKITVLNKHSVKFYPGIMVMAYYLAKGLEFDSVYVADGDNPVYDTPFGEQALYVCATRALHTFDIYK